MQMQNVIAHCIINYWTTNGILTFNADSFTYVHDGTETTTDSFTYQVNDGACDSNVTTVTITINPINDCPVVLDDTYTVDEGRR